MTLALTCRCGQQLEADDIDALLPIVQAHVDSHADAHGAPRHPISREQLLGRLQHRSDRDH